MDIEMHRFRFVFAILQGNRETFATGKSVATG